MKNPLAIILTLGGIALGIYGITMLGDSSASVDILGVELGVEDNDMKMEAFLFIGLGVASLIGGLFLMKKK